jgi:hypothetical protein
VKALFNMAVMAASPFYFFEPRGSSPTGFVLLHPLRAGHEGRLSWSAALRETGFFPQIC